MLNFFIHSGTRPFFSFPFCFLFSLLWWGKGLSRSLRKKKGFCQKPHGMLFPRLWPEFCSSRWDMQRKPRKERRSSPSKTGFFHGHFQSEPNLRLSFLRDSQLSQKHGDFLSQQGYSSYPHREKRRKLKRNQAPKSLYLQYLKEQESEYTKISVIAEFWAMKHSSAYKHYIIWNKIISSGSSTIWTCIYQTIQSPTLIIKRRKGTNYMLPNGAPTTLSRWRRTYNLINDTKMGQDTNPVDIARGNPNVLKCLSHPHPICS